jgi:hypothetical protein
MQEVLASSTKEERASKLLNDLQFMSSGSSIKAILRKAERTGSKISVLASPKGASRKVNKPASPVVELNSSPERKDSP